jgi:hypothetical protein
LFASLPELAEYVTINRDGVGGMVSFPCPSGI